MMLRLRFKINCYFINCRFVISVLSIDRGHHFVTFVCGVANIFLLLGKWCGTTKCSLKLAAAASQRFRGQTRHRILHGRR